MVYRTTHTGHTECRQRRRYFPALTSDITLLIFRRYLRFAAASPMLDARAAATPLDMQRYADADYATTECIIFA